jgi:CheY-like chemotaxis protein
MGRVLVVEDDDDNRGFLQALLLLDTHEVHTARNGLEALTWLRAQRRLPNCIVLDLDMPIMTGQEFLRQLQNDPRLAHIRVIVLSADPHKQTDHLPPSIARIEKPAAPEMLTDVVARCTRPSQGSTAG